MSETTTSRLLTDLPQRLPLPAGPAAGLVAIVGLFAALLAFRGGPDALTHYLSVRNLQVVAYEGTVTGILALGMLLVIVNGGIDLSVGSVVALVTVAAMLAYRALLEATGSMTLASLGAIPAGVLVGGACGLTNGAVIAGVRVSPFVATLGMLSAARGLALFLADRKPIAFPGGVRPEWAQTVTLVHPRWGLFNPGTWSLFLLAAVVAVFLRATILGRYCYAIGSNESTARLCGVSVGRTKVTLYTLAGLLAGWAGVLRFASVGGDPTGSQGLELEVIAAVVIGGASLAGGQGSVGGTLVGVFLLGVLLNGVRLLDLPVEIRYLVIGGVIIVSTALGRWQRRETG